MISRFALIFLMTLGLIGTASAASKQFVLAQGGESRVTIVVPKNADVQVARAANDLAYYIKAASGAGVSVVEDGTSVNGFTIQVGATALAEGAKLPLDKLEYDGYVIAPVGSAIIIRGRGDEGTMFGIYGFMRDYLGVRWYAPGKLWDFVPKADRLVIKVQERICNPDFPYRMWFNNCSLDAMGGWSVKNRIRYGARADAPYSAFGHNLTTIIPWQKYGKDHPEYFPLIDGRRMVPQNDNDAGVIQPCFTNQDVINIAVQAIREHFDRNPKSSQYSLSINDGPYCCKCPTCSALDEPYRQHRTGPQYSDSCFYFVDKVAREIAKSHPGKTLGCLAYWPVELPPRKIKRLPDNVVIQLTQDDSQHYDAAYLKADHEMHIAWSKIASKVTTYNYYGLGWFGPRYYPHLAAEDIKFLHKLGGVVGQCNEMYHYWAILAPQAYMAAELLWDADQDPDMLLNKFYRDLYGPVSPQMKEFYETLEKNWLKPRQGRWFEGFLHIDTETPIYDMDNMTKAKLLLDDACNKSSGVEKERVAFVRDKFRFQYAIMTGYDRAKSLDKLPLNNRSDFDNLAREMVQTLRLVAYTERVHAKYIQTDLVFCPYYYDANQPVFRNKMREWEEAVTVAVKDRFKAAESWANTNLSKEEADKLLRELNDKLAGVEMSYAKFN